MADIIIKSVVGVIASTLLATIIAMLKTTRDKSKLLEDGIQCMLRSQIIAIYHRSLDRGYCPLYEKENVEHAYLAYKALKGNGVIEGIYKEIIAMPTEYKEDNGSDN